MNSRPLIKLHVTQADRNIDTFSFYTLIFLWAFTVFSFIKLPEIIPIHFDASGRPDNYANKWTLFLLPVIATIVFAGLTYLNKYPQLFNYTVQITEENVQRQYLFATMMLRVIKCSIMLVYSIIALYNYWAALGKTEIPGGWFLPLILGIIFIPQIFLLLKCRRIK